KHMTHASVSAYLLRRRMDGLGQQRLLLTIGKTGLAALTMGAAARLTLPYFLYWFGAPGLVNELLTVGLSGGLRVAVFLGGAALLRIKELGWMVGLIRKRVFKS